MHAMRVRRSRTAPPDCTTRAPRERTAPRAPGGLPRGPRAVDDRGRRRSDRLRARGPGRGRRIQTPWLRQGRRARAEGRRTSRSGEGASTSWTAAAGAGPTPSGPGHPRAGRVQRRIFPRRIYRTKGIFPTKPVLAQPGAAQAVWIRARRCSPRWPSGPLTASADLRFGVSVDEPRGRRRRRRHCVRRRDAPDATCRRRGRARSR